MKQYTAQDLIELAVADAKLDDWGPGEFRDNLAELTNDVLSERVTLGGMLHYYNRVRRELVNRLHIVDDRRRDPLIAQQQISAPIFCLGLPRTGSTFIHTLLSQDPASRSCLQWEQFRPSPPPTAENFERDIRIDLAKAEMPHNPGFSQRHIHGAQLPVECGPMAFVYTFQSGTHYFRWNTLNHLRSLQRNIRPAYDWHKLMLQHLQSHTCQERWVLKSPEHLGHLPELLEVYPDARLVLTHRDPGKVIPSVSSLVAYMQSENLQPFDKRRTGPVMVDYWRWHADQYLAARRQFEGRVQFCDIDYRQLLDDPMSAVEKIYGTFGLRLTSQAETAMRDWLEIYRRDRYKEEHGEHKYTAEEYGLTAPAVRERFADYIEQHFADSAEILSRID